MQNAEQTEARKSRAMETSDYGVKYFPPFHEMPLATDRFKALGVASRGSALQNPKCPPGIIQAGCADPDPCVRAAALGHPRIPIQLAWVAFLRADLELHRRAGAGAGAGAGESWGVSCGQLRGSDHDFWNLSEDGSLARSHHRCDDRSELGRDIELCRRLITREVNELAGKNSFEGLAHLLESRISPNDLGVALDVMLGFFRNDVARGGNRTLRTVLAKHPRATDDQLLKLSVDPCAPVRAGVAKQVVITVKELKGTALADSAQEAGWEPTPGDPEVTSEILTRLSTDDQASVRAAVAGNHHLHPETLIRLSVDSDERVRRAATQRLLEAL
jgi:hypothetical protein